MKFSLLALVWFTTVHTFFDEPDILKLRSLFYAAEHNKTAWENLVSTVDQVNDQSKPVLLCYKGVAEMMGAKYASNPVTKLSRFKKGRSFIEKAAVKSPDNLEIRFLRFAIQTNLPSFLGYNDDITNDKEHLLAHISKSADAELKKNILKYLSSSKYCTDEEKKLLMK